METNTSTEGNGKELKVTRTNDTDKLIDKFFAKYIEENDKYPNLSRDLKEDAKQALSTHAITFEANEQTVKIQGGDVGENEHSFIEAINVLENGKRDFVLEEIAKGAGIRVGNKTKENEKAYDKKRAEAKELAIKNKEKARLKEEKKLQKSEKEDR